MTRAKAERVAPKRWLFHGILADTPLSSEDSYYSETELARLLQVAELLPGIRVSKLSLTPLPERKKKAQKQAETVEKTQATPSFNLTSALKTDILKGTSEKESK